VIDVQLAGPEGGIAKSTTVDKDQLCVEWADGHKSTFAAQWLLERTAPAPASAPTIKEGWQSAWMQKNMDSQCTFDFSEVLARGETTEGWLRALQRYGLTKLTGAPQNSGEISRLSQSLALPLRRTVSFFFFLLNKVVSFRGPSVMCPYLEPCVHNPSYYNM
jgi:hypothetical protein